MRLLALLGLPLLLAAAPVPHPYADATRRRIATAQDERDTATLLPFLTDKNATYRAAAALAFGSVQDKAAVPALLPLLTDKAPAVRRAVAFALGQTGDSTAAPALARCLPLAATYPERLALGEAFGRCTTRATLPLLWQALPVPPQAAATLPTPEVAAPGRRGSAARRRAARRPAAVALPDTARSTALAWGLYRAGLRGLLTPEAVRQLAAVLSQPRAPQAARRGAAAALVRARGGAALDSAVAGTVRPVLLRVMAADPDYFVRVNCATTLGRFRQPGVLPALLAATSHADFRVRLAALRALPERPYGVSEAVAEAALRRPLAQEALVAAEWLLRTHPDSPPPNLLALAQRTTHYRARATLLQAALRYAYSGADRATVADTIHLRLSRTSNPYEKAALLTALSEDTTQFEFLAEAANQLERPLVVPGTALSALVALRRQPSFPARQQLAFQVALRRALFGGDVTQLGTAAEALADPKLVPEPVAEDLAALRTAQGRLTIPRDVEAWLGIQQALDKINKVVAPVALPPMPPGVPRRQIDWAAVQRIPVGQRVRLTTTKGPVTLVLKVAEAPGSAATFVELVRQRFYDGLYFHRVVPDFVAQGGDPRGDGSGSLPYTLRSEFSYLPYATGAVGLASAGKDTESCQFFFTHLPTPHLDGRYTVFAQVVEGQDVVQRLEVGDRMLHVELL